MQDCKIGLQNRGICVVIPTYNNAGTIVDVVSGAQRYCSDVIVVSDGCTDDTLQLLSEMPEKPHIVQITHNSGKGKALKAGFEYAADAGFSFAITLDADGQHYPEDIPLFLQANRQHPDSIIVGRRIGLAGVERSKSSSFANHFSNFWFFVQTLVPLKDTQTGYRLYPIKRIGGLSLLTSRYEAELELLVLSAWKGVGIVSQDVNVYYPPKEERVSHFRPVYDFFRISLLNVVLCILAVVYGLPRKFFRGAFKFLTSLTIFLLYVFSMLFIVLPRFFIFIKSRAFTKEKLHDKICNLAHFAFIRIGLPGVSYSLKNNTGEDFSKPAVIVCNHQSHLDLLPMLALTPKLIILTADWVWKNPLYSFIIHNADYLPASNGIEAIAPQLRKLVDDGYSIVVYPEGTRSPDCSIGRFHQGAFYLADLFKLDILPVVLYGAGKALPKHGRILKSWPMCLEIDKRISPDKMCEIGSSYKEQASYLRAYYKARYREIADYLERTQL